MTLSLDALGVKAGTVIVNQAMLSFEVETKKFEIKSNKTKDVVEQLIDLNLHWLDDQYISVKNGEKDVLMGFKLTNTGNGKDNFQVYVNHSADSEVSVNNKKIFFDTNDNAQFDQEDKILKKLVLDSDQSKIIFITSDIPQNRSNRQTLAKLTCKAASMRGGSGVKGTVHPKKGVKGLDAIDGLNGGVSATEGVFIINNGDKPTLTKTLTVANKYGTNEPVEGSIITYKIVFALPYGKTVEGIKITDAIPDHTDYVKKSLKLDGVMLSDACDKDVGQFDSHANMIIVELDKVIFPQTHTIEFNVKQR